MGNVTSVPASGMTGDTDYFAIQIQEPDTLKIINAGKRAVNVIRLCLSPYNIINSEDYTSTNCYKFKLNGSPFAEGPSFFGGKANAVVYKYAFCDILSGLYNNGWETIISSDLSQKVSNSTVFSGKNGSKLPKLIIFLVLHHHGWINWLLFELLRIWPRN